MTTLTLDWVELVAIVGAIQGLVLTTLIGARRANRTANLLLAALVATMTLYLAAGPYLSTGLFRAHPQFLFIGYHTTWLFGPLVYLYARAASDRDWRFRARHLVHFVPVAITLSITAPLYLMNGADKIALWDVWSRYGITGPLGYVDPFKYASGLGYSAATALHLVRHRRVVQDSYSNIDRVSLRWLLFLTAATGAIWVGASFLVIARVSDKVRNGQVAIMMAVVVYGIGYMGRLQSEVVRYHADTREFDGDWGAPGEPEASHYAHSRLDDIEAVRLRDSLLQLMDTQQPWKEADLTLADLASRLSSTPNKLSQVLNAQLRLTFYDFVNGYRVREVQRRIKAGDARSLKMLALAMEAGFASKSTFNAVFKKQTLQTPSDFRQAVGG